MRTTFNISSSLELVSAVRPKGQPHALTVGTKLVLVHPYETEYGQVPAGAKALVEMVDDYDGTVWLLMEGIEPALFHWDNRLVLSPFTCEDLVACIKLPVDKQVPDEQLSVPVRNIEGTHDPYH
jgi:hypothetical protein